MCLYSAKQYHTYILESKRSKLSSWIECARILSVTTKTHKSTELWSIDAEDQKSGSDNLFSPMTLHIVAQEWYKSIYSIQYQIIFHIIRIIHLLVLYYILRLPIRSLLFGNMSPPTFSSFPYVLCVQCILPVIQHMMPELEKFRLHNNTSYRCQSPSRKPRYKLPH